MNKKSILKILSIAIFFSTIIFNTYYLKINNLAKATELHQIPESSSCVATSNELTKTELIEHYSKENNITFHEAELTLFKEKFNEDHSSNYKILSKNIGNNTFIEFYTSGNSNNKQYSIKKILAISIKNPKHTFSGNTYISLENNTTIYYDIEGNLLEQGATTVSSSINVGIEERAFVNLATTTNPNIHEHISTSGYLNLTMQNYYFNYKTIIKPLKNHSYLEIYVKGDGWRNYFSIEEILNVSVKNSNLGYSGNIYVNLEDNFHIHFDVEGVLEKNILKEPLFFENTPTSKNFVIQDSSVSIDDHYIHISDSGTITP